MCPYDLGDIVPTCIHSLIQNKQKILIEAEPLSLVFWKRIGLLFLLIKYRFPERVIIQNL